MSETKTTTGSNPPATKADAYRVVVVDDSAIIRGLLTRTLQTDPDIVVVDSVGEVLSLPANSFERNPATLDAAWREISTGVYRLKDQLLVVLDVARLLTFNKQREAA